MVSQWLFSFASSQISSIYDIHTEGHPLIIALVLFFITSPAEEIFWRGFIQKMAMDKYESLSGWLLGSAINAGVHLASGKSCINHSRTGGRNALGLPLLEKQKPGPLHRLPLSVDCKYFFTGTYDLK